MRKLFKRLKRAFQVFKDDPIEVNKDNEVWIEDIVNYLKESDIFVRGVLNKRKEFIEYLASRILTCQGVLGYVIFNFHDGEVIINKEDLEKYVYRLRYENKKYIVRAIVETEEIPK